LKEPIITKTLTNKITRIILRTMPIIPGPELYDLFIELKDGKKTINSKIEQAYKSLKETSSLVSDLETDLIERTEKVKELKETYEEYSKLAEIEEDKIQPLISQLEKTVGKSRNVERVVSFFINLFAGLVIFIIGIWAAPTVKNWIWPNENVEQTIGIQELNKNAKPKIENNELHKKLIR
jgi:ABC-type multidrug transport system fused ATPase/permease subunit